jgi:hypothetical protein
VVEAAHGREHVRVKRKWLVRVLVPAVVLFGLVQLVPYGRDRTNPPVTQEVILEAVKGGSMPSSSPYPDRGEKAAPSRGNLGGPTRCGIAPPQTMSSCPAHWTTGLLRASSGARGIVDQRSLFGS